MVDAWLAAPNSAHDDRNVHRKQRSMAPGMLESGLSKQVNGDGGGEI